ncbi:hydrogenase formation protein HypD [Dehalobacter sp. DCM]|uniref:hydrogenase formation protein HypD n=1 Tax=Dehalobacter sp. DCM TaxID=2907827 RepID=UPI0030814126|nr:hydrogenase formation protein HypD [Dehalobacter sp. DCM]
MDLEFIIKEIGMYDDQEIQIMEVCGTHTSSIFKNGIRSMLSPKIKLISGPGCPVCVTPAAYIDQAIAWSLKPDTVLLTFGDMMKVPGTEKSLSEAKAEGAKVEIMYSPQEAVKKAAADPQTTFVIACVGFETTIPSYALVLEHMTQRGVSNIKLLTALRRVMPALDFICSTDNAIAAFIAPGHVSTILGSNIYSTLAERYAKPFAVAGFEGEHILIAIYDLLQQMKNNKAQVHNLYPSAVKPEGNQAALKYIDDYFESGPAFWRGIGVIADSGYYLRPKYQQYDAGSFDLTGDANQKPTACRCGEVILGKINPDECPMFAKACTPAKAQGPCMVSSEGTCGIWYRFSKK